MSGAKDRVGDRVGDGTVALELADAGVVAWGGAGPLAAPSPGYAVIDGSEILTGEAARSRARLTPRRTHHRFWRPLDDTPLPRPFPRRWTHADLAHRHLADLRHEVGAEPERVIAAVPGDLGHDELGRLLGIAGAAGWPIGALVDGAIAAAATVEIEADLVWHLEVGLHRTVATELVIDGGVTRRRVAVGEVGRIGIERLFARHFARRLVGATRYDPLHSAAAEQGLYDAMGGWLEELRGGGEVIASVAASGRGHEVEVTAREVEGAASDAYRRIAALLPADRERGSWRLLLGSAAAALPGLAATLGDVAGAAAAVDLEPGAAARGALTLADRVLAPGGDPPFVVRLTARDRGAA